MSIRDGRNFSICQPLSEPQDDADRFYELMKSAAPEKTPGDDEESTVGVNPDQYPDPKDRERNNIDAPWGESDVKSSDPAGTAQHHSNAVWDGFKQSREKFLKRHFDSYDSSSDNAQDVLRQNFDHASKGDFEASKPMTGEASKRQPEVAETVLDKTKRLLGTY
jgi:hypothetical protein